MQNFITPSPKKVNKMKKKENEKITIQKGKIKENKTKSSKNGYMHIFGTAFFFL